MADPVVVDTDLLIDFLRGRGPGAALVRDLLKQQRLRMTAISAFELRMGTDFLARRDDIVRLIRRRTYPLDAPSAIRAAEVASALRASGQPLALADCLVAGICLRHDLPLATRNRRHFERVDGLQLMPIRSTAG